MLIAYNSAAFSTASGLAVGASASVEVRREDTGALASIFSDRDGASAQSNPFTADAKGRFVFYVDGLDDGYRIDVTVGAETHTLRYQMALDVPAPRRMKITNVVAALAGTFEAATPLAFGINLITQADEHGTCLLPPATGSGKEVLTIIDADDPVLIYPESGGQINRFGVDIAYSQTPRSMLLYRDVGVKQWHFLAEIPFLYPIVFRTAFAGGGQANGTAIQYGTTVFETVATDLDSGLLPVALGGCNLIAIYNRGAKLLAVYPQLGQKISGLAANEYISIPPGKFALLLDIGPGPDQWIHLVHGAGMPLPFVSNTGTFNPTDGETRYFGSFIPIASEGLNRIYFHRDVTIRRVWLQTAAFTVQGSTENASAYLRVNASVDHLLSSTVKFDQIANQYALELATPIIVRAGSFIEGKVVFPTFATDPTGCYVAFVPEIEQL